MDELVVHSMLDAMNIRNYINKIKSNQSFSVKITFRDYIYPQKDYEIITVSKKVIFFGKNIQ